jgi:uncharacterized membrane protein
MNKESTGRAIGTVRGTMDFVHTIFPQPGHNALTSHAYHGDKVEGVSTIREKEVNKMRKRISILIGGLLAVLMIVGAVSATVAYAQKDTPPPSDSAATGDQPLRGGRGLGQAELEAAATALGMTTDELSAALEAGKSLEDLATAAGVDIQVVQDAISAAHKEEMRTQIEAGVADGSISEEKGAWLLEGLEKGFLDEPSFGLGFGREFGRGGPDDGAAHRPMSAEALAAAANALGMTSEDLQAALATGASLQQLSEKAGVDYATVMDAVRAVMPDRQGQHP